jgi:hypothetical protein
MRERLTWRTVTPGTRIEEDRASMATTFTYLFALGAVLLLLTLLLPAATDRNELGLAAVVVAALLAAAGFAIASDRLPVGVFKLSPALGSTVIAGALFFGGAEAIGAYATFFFWVALSAAYFFSMRVAIANVAFACAVYGLALATRPGLPLPGLYWSMFAGTLLVAGPVMIALRNHAERAADEADRVKAEFSALISHELRTPLTSIIGYLDVLAEEGGFPGTPDQQKALDVINRNSRRRRRARRPGHRQLDLQLREVHAARRGHNRGIARRRGARRDHGERRRDGYPEGRATRALQPLLQVERREARADRGHRARAGDCQDDRGGPRRPDRTGKHRGRGDDGDRRPAAQRLATSRARGCTRADPCSRD